MLLQQQLLPHVAAEVGAGWLENSFVGRSLMGNMHQQHALQTVNVHRVLGHVNKSTENRKTQVLILKYFVLCLSAISQMLFWAIPYTGQCQTGASSAEGH